MAAVTEKIHVKVAQATALSLDNLARPNGNLMTKSLSNVMRQRNSTLASDEMVESIPARLHQTLCLQ
jgi:hypothetical protein